MTGRTVWIENATGEDLSAFSILSIDGFLFDQDSDENEEPNTEPGINEILSNGLCFNGVKPTPDKPVAIVVEDIAAGNVGRAVVNGPAVVSIDMKSKTHQYAEIVEDEPEHLQSCESGQAPAVLLRGRRTGVPIRRTGLAA